jgi:hypothetical protein
MITTDCPRCGAPATAGARFCRTCGAALTDTPPAPEPQPGPAALPGSVPQVTPAQQAAPDPAADRVDALAPALAWWNRRPRGRTPWLAGVGVALVLVLALAGYLVAVAVGDARNPPEQPVRALFAALAARDTAAAAELAGCTTAACTGTVLATGYEPPTDVHLGKVSYGEASDDTRRPDKSLAYVPVTYRLGGTDQQVTIRVQRAGSGLARPFRILAGGTGRLTVTAAHLQHVQLAGALVPTGKPDTAVTVLPGTYTARVPDTDPLFTATGPVNVDVPATADERADPTPLTLPVKVRPDVVDQVDEQIRAFLHDCAKQDTLTPRGCPFQVPGIVIGADEVRWTLQRPPVVDVVPADDPTGAPATVRTTTPGQVSVTYTAFTSAGGDRDTITEQLPVTITGTVDVDPDHPDRVVWTG